MLIEVGLLWCNVGFAGPSKHIDYACTNDNDPALPLSLELIITEKKSIGILGSLFFDVEELKYAYEMTYSGTLRIQRLNAGLLIGALKT